MTTARDPPAGVRTLVAAAAVLAGTAAGVGWLYLLRDTGALRVGPALRDALALDRLAGRDAQPLPRVLAAFVPAGLFAGLALRALTPLGPTARALAAGVPAYVLLGVIGAASDAVSRSEPVARFVGAQPTRAAVIVPALVMAVCASAVRGRAAAPGGRQRFASPGMQSTKRTQTPTQDPG